jgi:hypothetical protein
VSHMASDGLRVDNRTRHPRWNFAPTPSIRRCPQCWSKRDKMEKTALWQAANEALVLIATRGGPTMLARIGGMRALHRHVVHEFNPDHKGAHWGSRSGTNSRFPVSSLQQLVCSFEGTKILVRPVRSPVQFSNDRGRRGHFRKQAILSPAGRWILPGGPFAPILSGMEFRGGAKY